MTKTETKDKTTETKKNEVSLAFSKRALNALKDHVSHDESRFFLMGYHIEKVDREEILICSTNGRSLVRVRIKPMKEFNPDNDRMTCFTDYKELERKILTPPKLKPKNKVEALCLKRVDDGFKWVITSTPQGIEGLSEPVTFIEGAFPNVDSVWPKKSNGQDFKRVEFNGAYFPEETFIMNFFGKGAAMVLKWTGQPYGDVFITEDIESLVMPIER